MQYKSLEHHNYETAMRTFENVCFMLIATTVTVVTVLFPASDIDLSFRINYI